MKHCRTTYYCYTQSSNKFFLISKVDVKLSLGQLIRNAMFEEAETEFQQYAFFKTRIGKYNYFNMFYLYNNHN